MYLTDVFNELNSFILTKKTIKRQYDLFFSLWWCSHVCIFWESTVKVPISCTATVKKSVTLKSYKKNVNIFLVYITTYWKFSGINFDTINIINILDSDFKTNF